MSIAVASPPHLLVVEDDQELLELVQGVLKEEGYGVTAAASLPDSLAALEQQLFHFVLTDLFSQPGKSHPLQSIQPLLAQAAPIPVGVVTAWQVPEDDPALADLAFLLRKPFDLDDFLRKVDAEMNATSHSTHQNQLVEQFFLAINARDWQLLSRLCTPDVRMAPLKAPAVAVFAPHSELFSVRATLEQRTSSLPGYTIEEVRVFPRPFGVSARYIARWQSSDGIAHRAAGSMHFRFRRGRIAQIEGAF